MPDIVKFRNGHTFDTATEHLHDRSGDAEKLDKSRVILVGECGDFLVPVGEGHYTFAPACEAFWFARHYGLGFNPSGGGGQVFHVEHSGLKGVCDEIRRATTRQSGVPQAVVLQWSAHLDAIVGSC